MGDLNASSVKKIVCATISITFFLILWQLSVTGTELGVLMPGPLVVGAAFFQSFVNPIGTHSIFGHVLFSLSRVVVGYSIAAVLGITLGILMGRYKKVEAIFKPLYELIRPIPPIAWTPLVILWFGLGETTKWFLIFLSSFNQIVLNTYDGSRTVDETLLGVSKMLGANNFQTLFNVVLPYSVPYIFAGLHVAVSSSWATVVAAEMIRSTEGVGWIIVNAMEMNNTVQVLVGIVSIGIVGYVLAIAMRKLEGALCAWNKGGR